MAKTEQNEQPFSGIDKKDLEIVALLQQNARLTVREIARQVHLSPTPTFERIKRLEQEGVIRNYGALVDHRKVGKSIMVICNISLREHNKAAASAFIEGITALDEVIECYNISGDFDFMLKIVASSMESFHKFFVDRLNEVPNIGQTRSFFVMDVIKQTHIV